MSLAAKGAFIDMLAYQFANGSIPDDDRTICRIVGAFPDEWAAVRDEVLPKFEHEEGVFINARMQKERDEREEIRSKRVDAVNKRWGKTDTSDDTKPIQVNTVCMPFAPDFVDTSPSPSPSPSLTKKKRESRQALLVFPSDFSEARKATLEKWIAYKAEKKQAYKPLGWKAVLTALSGLDDASLETAVNHSMAGNYAGIFEPKNQSKQPPPQPERPKRKYPDNWREIGEELFGEPITVAEFDDLDYDRKGDLLRHILEMPKNSVLTTI